MELQSTTLKKKHRELRDNWVTDNAKLNSLRIHRALSWLKAADETVNDDMSFISLWISFNSLYGKESSINDMNLSERFNFKHFFQIINEYDKNKTLSSKLWEHYSNLFRLFINNKFVFAPFWSFTKELISQDEWQERFNKSILLSKKALGHQDSALFLGLLFERLYVLRNQIMHGAATFESSVNREQITLAIKILSDLVPLLIDILLDNPEIDLGAPSYPPIN